MFRSSLGRLSLFTLLAAAACSSADPPAPAADAGANLGVDASASGTPDGGEVERSDGGAEEMCTNLTVFRDADQDRYGTSADSMDACLLPGEELAGYSRQAGDCKDGDPWAHSGAEEVCGDYVDDDCDEADEACPTTQTAGLELPNWDCVSGPAPANVYAYALFSDGGSYYQPNGCFVFFEGLRNEFYVQRVNLNRVNQAAACAQLNGCVCPSDGGWPSYDRRLFAWTLAGAPESCPEIRVIDHGGETQPVSNDCRKYLYQLHWPGREIPYSFVAGSLESIERRVDVFPTVEIACASEQYPQLPFRTLLTAQIQKSSSFVKKP